MKSQAQRRFLGLKTISNQAYEKIDQEIEWATMARMLNVRNIFELVIDGLDDRAFAEEDFVFEQHQAVFHIFAQFGDEVERLLAEKLVKESMRQIAFIGKQLTEEGPGKLWHWYTVMDIGSRQTASQQFTAVIGNNMEFEPIKPAQ